MLVAGGRIVGRGRLAGDTVRLHRCFGVAEAGDFGGDYGFELFRWASGNLPSATNRRKAGTEREECLGE